MIHGPVDGQNNVGILMQLVTHSFLVDSLQFRMPRITKRSIAFLIICVFCCLLHFGCSFPGESVNTPQEMFEYVIKKPIPSYVNGLEGAGYGWQGYSIYLKFNASEEFTKDLLAQGYEITNWKGVKRYFEPSWKMKMKFKFDWSPSKILNKVCLESEVKNSWTHLGFHYFVIDQNTNQVYFHGIGN